MSVAIAHTLISLLLHSPISDLFRLASATNEPVDSCRLFTGYIDLVVVILHPFNHRVSNYKPKTEPPAVLFILNTKKAHVDNPRSDPTPTTPPPPALLASQHKLLGSPPR